VFWVWWKDRGGQSVYKEVWVNQPLPQVGCLGPRSLYLSTVGYNSEVKR
jgi:hypothetical protein